jgi:hypothetical protein
MELEKSSKVIAFIISVISLLSLVAALLLGDQGMRGQVIVISVLAASFALLVYIGANRTRKSIYDAKGQLQKTHFPTWFFVSLATIFILWLASIAGLFWFVSPKPFEISPLVINLVNSSETDVTIDARADFELLLGARASLGATVARGTLDLVAADGQKRDFLTIPAKSNLLVGGYFRNPSNYRSYLENGDTDIELYIYKTGGGLIISPNPFRFDSHWLEKYRLDLEVSPAPPTETPPTTFTDTPLPPPTSTNAPPSPTPSPTTDLYASQGDCDQFSPPCTYRVREGDYYSRIASRIYGNDLLATTIMNNNRNEDGSYRNLHRGDTLYLPSLDAIPPLPFSACRTVTTTFPCQYRAYAGDTFETIAQDFYHSNAFASLIKNANLTFSGVGESGLEPVQIKEGVILVLPVKP